MGLFVGGGCSGVIGSHLACLICPGLEAGGRLGLFCPREGDNTPLGEDMGGRAS